MPDNRRVAEDIISCLVYPERFTLPQPVDVDNAAQQILALYEESGREGATFSLYFGNMSGQPLYSVSVWPERGTQPSDNEMSVSVIQDFIEANSDVLNELNDPRCGIGLWYNADDNAVYLDIVALLPSRLEAVALAMQYDQIAIFDLNALTDIETGGTGNGPSVMPPATKRLPRIRSQKDEEL
jgi:hypothetical protein